VCRNIRIPQSFSVTVCEETFTELEPFSEANRLLLVGCALVFLGMLSAKSPQPRF
jgi:hypothetical protein